MEESGAGSEGLSEPALGSTTAIRVLPSPDAIGEDLATRILARIDESRELGKPFLLGCPTGRTPRPIYAAMARRLAETRQELSHLVLVMMDEYLVPAGARFGYASANEPWSCHHFARAEIVERFNAPLPPSRRIPDDAIWFPDPNDGPAYDIRIAEAGDIDLFLLASGASDGHVAFNPPGSPRASLTRVIQLSEETRRDNLQTFPAFGSLDAVPKHGVSVGISTIATAKSAVMVAWGAGKRLTVSRMRAAKQYDPSWPATVIHEVAVREIVCDADAAASDIHRA
jgi:glucosamine-6-phosphate deaminase